MFVQARAGLWTVGFDNPDIGGIAYNAELISRGKPPYVDSWEFKAPGTFFLFAGVFSIHRSLAAVQVYRSPVLVDRDAIDLT